MSSSNKTLFANLNKWIGADKPKMEDFNSDNTKIDLVLSQHIPDDDIHITSDERLLWTNAANNMVTGSYVGDNSISRTISLGFSPVFMLVYAVDTPLSIANSENSTILNASLCSHLGNTPGITLSANGFTAKNAPAAGPDGVLPKLNMLDITYVYIAFKL